MMWLLTARLSRWEVNKKMLLTITIPIAVAVTVLGILYLFTIGRLTDVIPFLGFADDVLVVFFMLFVWLMVLLSAFMESPFFWALLLGGVLTWLEYRKGFVTKFLKKR